MCPSRALRDRLSPSCWVLRPVVDGRDDRSRWLAGAQAVRRDFFEALRELAASYPRRAGRQDQEHQRHRTVVRPTASRATAGSGLAERVPWPSALTYPTPQRTLSCARFETRSERFIQRRVGRKKCSAESRGVLLEMTYLWAFVPTPPPRL